MNLTKYVSEQKRKSVELRKLATETKDFEKSKELRKLQDEQYKKYIFLKKLKHSIKLEEQLVVIKNKLISYVKS